MNILSIDTGTYSVKFVELRQERRHLVVEHVQEIIIDEVAKDYDYNLSTRELQDEIIKAYLQDLQLSGKIISQLPNDLITNRYIDIPINNRKKAELMVPHQLDGNLPYAIHKSHYIYDLFKGNNNYFAVINVAQYSSFDEYYSQLSKNKILPTHLFSEMSLMLGYAWENKIKGPICILDIGHSTTNAYFIHDGKVVANHTSYLAGSNITDTIAETYQISKEEARVYKHQKSFFLTEAQYSEVNDAQKDFASIMKQIMAPLISDFKRWELGFRVKHALPIDKVLICGGTSNIENIENFLSYELGISAGKLGSPFGSKDKSSMTTKEEASFTIASLLALTQAWKWQPSNFLKGQYVSNYSDSIPLHSTIFLATRTAIISLILGLGLIGNYITTTAKDDSLSKEITKLLKSSALELTAREVRNFSKSPEQILKKLVRKEKQMKLALKALENSSEKDAIIPLSQLSNTVGKNDKISLITYNYESGLAYATFESDDARELADLKLVLEKSDLESVKVTYKEGANDLSLEFRY